MITQNLFQGNWQIKRVHSNTGPYAESILSDAIRKPSTVPGETTLLWSADPSEAGIFVFSTISIQLTCNS